jgi:hypothetical protein
MVDGDRDGEALHELGQGDHVPHHTSFGTPEGDPARDRKGGDVPVKHCPSLDALTPALFLSIALLDLTLPGACAAQQRVDIVPDDVALLIARIEAPQSPCQRELTR